MLGKISDKPSSNQLIATRLCADNALYVLLFQLTDCELIFALIAAECSNTSTVYSIYSHCDTNMYL